MRVWSSGIHHVAVGPLDVACSKDLTNTTIMVYFGVFWGCISRGLGGFGCGCSCRRAGAVCCRKSGGAVLRTPPQPRRRAASDLVRSMRPVVA